MKKIFAMVFLAASLVTLAETAPVLDKEVQGINKEQLEFKEIKTNDVLLKDQKLEASSSEITNDRFQNQDHKIKVVQGEKSALEDELSQGVEKKSFIKYIIGGIAVIAIAVAL